MLKLSFSSPFTWGTADQDAEAIVVMRHCLLPSKMCMLLFSSFQPFLLHKPCRLPWFCSPHTAWFFWQANGCIPSGHSRTFWQTKLSAHHRGRIWPKTLQRKVTLYDKNIIQQKTLIGRLHQYFFLQIFLYYIIHTWNQIHSTVKSK